MTTNILSSALTVSPYDEPDKRYIGGKVVNVTYHLTDWWKCFHPNITDRIFTDAVRGFCIENIDCPFSVAVSALKHLSDMRIIGYADYFNRVMDDCNSYLKGAV